jgi:CRP/FNR family transcriptional regulator, cyclic AMP receptor protein
MSPSSPSADASATRRFDVPRAAPWSGWALVLAEVPLFGSLPKRHLKTVAGLAELRWYGDGRTLVRAGAPGDAFFAILDGRAWLQTPSGHTRTLEAKECFGELALIDGAPRSATVVSSGGVSVARIQRAAFLKLLREEPGIATGLARGLVATVRGLEETRGVQAVGGALPGRPTEPVLSPGEPVEPPGSGAAAREAARIALPLLPSVPLFAELPKRHLRRVAHLAELRRYRDGSVVVRAGARGTVFHAIVEGRADAVPPGGRARVLGPGEWFGEFSLLDGAPRSATVSAVGELATLRIERAAFLKLLNEEPGIATGVVRGLVALIRELEREDAG